MVKRIFGFISLILIIAMLGTIVNTGGVALADNNHVMSYDRQNSDIMKLKDGETVKGILGSTITCLGECKSTGANNDSGIIRYEVNSAESNADNIISEFNVTGAQFGKVLDSQMRNYLENITGKNKVTFEEDAGENGIYSYAVFDLGGYSFYEDDNIMLMTMQAISTYSSLCTLYTQLKYSYTYEGNRKKIKDLYIACTERESTVRKKVSDYELELNKLVSIPMEENLCETDKILYVHDRIVNIGNYVDSNDAVCHTPAAVLVNKEGVCQSYANAFNHALLMMGIDTIIVCSSTHSWNAVRLDGKWYYIDVTWADPVNTDTRSYARHDYMFVDAQAFAGEHLLDDMYQKEYGKILDNFGNIYSMYYPKTNKIVRSMWYSGGCWYYVNNGKMYKWNSAANENSQIRNVQYNKYMCLVELGGKIYYSNSSGIYSYENNNSVKVISGAVTDMYIDGECIKYVAGNKTDSYVPETVNETPTPTVALSPTASPTSVPTASPTAVPTSSPVASTVAPTVTPTVSSTPLIISEPKHLPAEEVTAETETTKLIPKASIKKYVNLKGKRVRIKAAKIKNAAGYELSVQIKNKASKTVYKRYSKNDMIISKLKKGKTYYIKVRAYIMLDGKRSYGNWSKRVKITIKR